MVTLAMIAEFHEKQRLDGKTACETCHQPLY